MGESERQTGSRLGWRVVLRLLPAVVSVVVTFLVSFVPRFIPRIRFEVLLTPAAVALLVGALLTLLLLVKNVHRGRSPGTSTAWILFVVLLMVMAFALLYTGTGIEVPSYAEARLPFKVDHSFVSSLYFSIVTFTTLGFGDFRPVPAARFLAAGEALIGFVSPGAFLAALIEMLRGRKR